MKIFSSSYTQNKNYSIIQNHLIEKFVGLLLLCIRSDFEFFKRSVYKHFKNNLPSSFWLFIGPNHLIHFVLTEQSLEGKWKCSIKINENILVSSLFKEINDCALIFNSTKNWPLNSRKFFWILEWKGEKFLDCVFLEIRQRSLIYFAFFNHVFSYFGVVPNLPQLKAE